MAGIDLKIISPYEVVYDGRVDFVIMRTTVGDAAIKTGHEPYMTLLDDSPVRLFKENEPEEIFIVIGGYAAFSDDKLTIMSTIANTPEEILKTIDELAQSRVASRELERENDLEIQKIETSLRRALVNMDVSSYAILKGKTEKLG